MMKNIEVRQNGGVSNSSNLSAEKERLDESLGQLKIEDNDNGNGGAVTEVDYPDRPGEPDCIYYLRTGTCAYGSRCRFNHPPYSGQGVQNTSELPEQDGQPECRGTMGHSSFTSVLADPAYDGQMHLSSTPLSHLHDRPDQPECHDFVNTGSCKYGSDCKYHHPKDKVAPISSNSFGPLGLPLRPGQAVCLHYSQQGHCNYGPTCKFDHPLGGYLYNYNSGVPSLLIDQPNLPYQWNLATVRSAETSPSKSSKFPDIKKAAEVAKKRNL